MRPDSDRLLVRELPSVGLLSAMIRQDCLIRTVVMQRIKYLENRM